MSSRASWHVKGRVRWFKDSPGLGGGYQLPEFLVDVVPGLDLRHYRRLTQSEVQLAYICRVTRVDLSGDTVFLEFLSPSKVLPTISNSVVLLRGPYPVGYVKVEELRPEV